ncbi:CsbD family protein [Methylobacterium radiodurans]|uniref:CsbD family protein n=1 Tax=Methylobacterium radiodurans TaxID=2202828 RepID=A0A2U8VXE4_9HYPH|nr:CsbD family protein [Methylobacterium radiodurans]AWN38457.1 CsbD family protein [Methylobacterium radiodurans]
MNRDQIRGASRHLKGRAQTALGGLAGDPARQVRGAVNQVAGGAQYAYGRARDRAEDLYEDGRDLADTARGRADDLIPEGRHLAHEARRRGKAYGRRAVRYADGHRTHTVLGLAVLAFAAGWLTRRGR